MLSAYLNYLFKGPISKHSYILRYWGLGLPHKSFGGGHNSDQNRSHLLSTAAVRGCQGTKPERHNSQILKGLASPQAKEGVLGWELTAPPH